MNKHIFGKLKAWVKSLLPAKSQEMNSPWEDYETLSLVPLEEIEEMVKQEAIQQEKRTKRETLTTRTHEAKSDPHVADLTCYETLPTVITCFSHDDNNDPNQRITHYPPSNLLH